MGLYYFCQINKNSKDLSSSLYDCESWTLTAELERSIQALEMRCSRRLLNISYKDNVKNEEIRIRIHAAIGVHDDLLTGNYDKLRLTVRSWKMLYCCTVNNVVNSGGIVASYDLLARRRQFCRVH